MAYMAPPSDQSSLSGNFKGLGGSGYMQSSPKSGVLSPSQLPVISPSSNGMPSYCTSVVSEGQTSLYARTHGNSPSYQTAGSPSGWQTSNMHGLENSMQGTSGASIEHSLSSLHNSDCNINRGSISKNPVSSPELLGSAMASGEWQQIMDSNMHFSHPMVSLLTTSGNPVSYPSRRGNRGGMLDGSIMQEITGRLGGNLSGKGVPPLGLSHAAGRQRLASGHPMEKPPTTGNSWSAMNAASNLGLTMDSSKGLATSHCLAQFSSDPGFAERAAKFSSFSNSNYSQLSRPSHPLTEGGKSRTVSGAPQPADNDGNHSKSSSCSRLVILGASTGAAGVSTGKKAKTAEDANDSDGREGDDPKPDGSANFQSLEAIEGDTGAVTKEYDETKECDKADGLDTSSCHEQVDGAGSSQGAQSGIVCLGKRKISPEEKGKDTSGTVASPGATDGKVLESDEAKAKRHKGGEGSKEREDVKPKAERTFSENSGDSSPSSMKESPKPQEPPKQDYIHVRARRGQATDSHSLAERVRREKISERMKFLQDLVPGCSKVTGKAVMLDEIINYVQSLQRQVELLSMKLAAVNPQVDINLDNFLTKEMVQLHSSLPATPMVPEIPYGQLPAQRQLPLQLGGPCGVDFSSLEISSEAKLRRSISAPVTAPMTCLDALRDTLSQTSSLWDGELQSIVQMGFTQGTPLSLTSQGPHGQLPGGHMKVEL